MTGPVDQARAKAAEPQVRAIVVPAAERLKPHPEMAEARLGQTPRRGSQLIEQLKLMLANIKDQAEAETAADLAGGLAYAATREVRP